MSRALLMLILLTQSVQAQVVDYNNIVGKITLASASGPTKDAPVKLTYKDGLVWNLYCREDAVGTTKTSSAGLSINTASKEVAITYGGETFAVPSPTVYTNLGGNGGILVKAAATESYSESTGPSVITEYTNSANFMFLTTNIGREFTANITEQQDYRRDGQLVATCIEKYRVVGSMTPVLTDSGNNFSILDWVKGWVRKAVVDEDKSKNSFKTSTSFGVRG